MVLPLLLCWTVVYVLMEYIFEDWTPLRRMLLTLAFVLPVWLAAFYPYYLDPRALALATQANDTLGYYQPLYIQAVRNIAFGEKIYARPVLQQNCIPLRSACRNAGGTTWVTL